MTKQEIIVLDKRETLGESLLADAATFGLLGLCIWISQGSRWWTFFTALMFLTYMIGLFSSEIRKRRKVFDSLDALHAWVEQERSIEAKD